MYHWAIAWAYSYKLVAEGLAYALQYCTHLASASGQTTMWMSVNCPAIVLRSN